MEPPAEQPYAILKGRQRDCMLLVKEGLSSKQIARELGISPRTVDQHVAGALETLGVTSRMAAISRLYEMERAEDVPQAGQPFMFGAAWLTGEVHVTGSRAEARSAAVLPPLGGAMNTASRSERMNWMIRIVIFCIMASCAGILTVLGVSEIVSGAGR